MTQYNQDQEQEQEQEPGRIESPERARQYHREASLRASEMFGTKVVEGRQRRNGNCWMRGKKKKEPQRMNELCARTPLAMIGGSNSPSITSFIHFRVCSVSTHIYKFEFALIGPIRFRPRSSWFVQCLNRTYLTTYVDRRSFLIAPFFSHAFLFVESFLSQSTSAYSSPHSSSVESDDLRTSRNHYS